MPGRRGRAERPVGMVRPWSRRRILLTGGLLGSVVVVGVGLLGWSMLAGAPSAPRPAVRPVVVPAPRPSTTAVVDSAAARDALAAAPMASVGEDAALPQPLAAEAGPRLVVPAAGDVDDLGVAVGYPQTPAGAVGQLAAIDTAALAAVDVDLPGRVIAEWAAPGGPTAASWSLARGMRELMDGAGIPMGSAAGAVLSYRPSMGMVKGSLGRGFVVACVNGEVALTVNGRTERIAAADCQRMVWDTGQSRWVIGAGAEPAVAPSVWPGSRAAVAAGWKVLDHAG